MIAIAPRIYVAVPIRGHGPKAADAADALDNFRIAAAAVAVVAAVAGHLVAIHYIDFATLTSFDQNVRIRSGLIWRNQYAARAKISVGSIEAMDRYRRAMRIR
jgi:hypothetical protein